MRSLRFISLSLIIMVAVVGLLLDFSRQYYYLHILTLCYIYAIASSGWDICYGYAGLLNLGASAFWGMGAYFVAFQYLWFGITPWIGIFTAALISAAIGTGIGALTTKTKGLYFALATLAFPNVLLPIFTWRYEITGGSYGLTIPWTGENAFAMQFKSPTYYYFISLAFLVLMCFVKERFSMSKYGYYLRAIGADEVAASSIGINSFRIRLIGIAFSSFMLGIAGGIYFCFLRYVDPYEAFGWNITIQFVLATILGGVGTIIGPIVGILIFTPFSEIVKLYLERAWGSRFIGMHFVIYGATLMCIILLMPKGVYPKMKKYFMDKWCLK